MDNGPGENTLVWIPMGLNHSDAWPQPTADTTYMVEVSNVLIEGTPRSFEYSVTVFDRDAEVTSIALTTLKSFSPSLPRQSILLVLGALVVVGSGVLVQRLRGDK